MVLEEPVNTPDDILTRLQAIHCKFNSSKDQEDDKPVLTRMEKVDPSKKLLEKLKMYENCDGSVEQQQVEKLRKEYFEGLQFTTMQTALQLFKSSSQNREHRRKEMEAEAAKTTPPQNVMSKGAINDIRSVFVDAITYDPSMPDNQSNMTFTDDDWQRACTESRIRKLLTLSMPYLRSYREMTSDLVQDSVRRAFLDVTNDNYANSLSQSSGQTSQTIISDRQWFLGLNESRVEDLIARIIARSEGKIDLTADMWAQIRSALLHCVSSTAALFNRQRTIEDKPTLPSGLTSRKIEKILSEIKKEFKNSSNKKDLDMKIVEGITSDLKKRIQLAMKEHDSKRRKSSTGSAIDGTAQLPEKLTADRLNRIFTEYKSEQIKSVLIDPNEYEGLTSSIREKILKEMSKEPVKSAPIVIDVDAGTASIAKQRFMDDIVERNTRVRSAEDGPEELPKAIDQEKISMFIQQANQSSPSGWVPDVELQVGLAKERANAFLSVDGKDDHPAGGSVWTPDVPITTGIARNAVASLMTEKHAQGREIPWSPDIELESGIARNRAQTLMTAADPSLSGTPQSQWQLDVIVQSGSVGRKADHFMKDYKDDEAREQQDWKPDVDLPIGLTQQRINSLYTQTQGGGQANMDAKDAHELIHSGLTKERLSELMSPKDKDSNGDKEWCPDVELRKGLTKERTSLFHNLETLRQSEYNNSGRGTEEQDELREFASNAATAKRVVIEVENDPLPQDPNIARDDKTTEQASIESGHTKLILKKLKDAYHAIDEKPKDESSSPVNELSLSTGHAQTLRKKFTDFEADAKTVHTAITNQTEMPRRFVSNPAPIPIQCDIVTEEKCLCCKQLVYSTEGVNIENKGYVHKRCMRCPKCQKIPPYAEAVLRNNQIFCAEHLE